MRFVHCVAALASFPLLTSPFAGCASKPALPKRAALSAGFSDSRPDFAATVAEADIIYFPAERAASGARSEPAALLLEAFQANGTPFAIAWDNISSDQQPLLDEFASQQVAAREKSLARVEIGGTGRAREHCRAVLRETGATGIRQLALRPPAHASNEGAAESQGEPPSTMRFRVPPFGLETFAERMTAAESLSGRDVASAYRARLASQQFAAEQIVRFFQTRGIPKLLVFIQTSDLESSDGVPFYVAQKLKLRQVVLGANAPRSSAMKLLTRSGPGSGWRGFQIVDGAPVAGSQ